MAMIEVQVEPDGLLTFMDESELVKTTGVIENDVESTIWVEYRLKSDPAADRPVHRSVNMRLKKPAVWGVGDIGKF